MFSQSLIYGAFFVLLALHVGVSFFAFKVDKDRHSPEYAVATLGLGSVLALFCGLGATALAAEPFRPWQSGAQLLILTLFVMWVVHLGGAVLRLRSARQMHDRDALAFGSDLNPVSLAVST